MASIEKLKDPRKQRSHRITNLPSGTQPCRADMGGNPRKVSRQPAV